jgi:HAE1 family hydrophobic/amphiphilic exporter-1
MTTLVEVVDTVGVAYVSQFNLYDAVSLTITPAVTASSATVMKRVVAIANEVLPEGMATSWSGVSYQEADASGSGGWIYVVTLLFVFLALASLYESWGLPIAILLSVPIAVLGSLSFVGLSHLLSPLFVNDVYLQISLVMLIGLTAKNAILVVEYADKRFFEEGLSLDEATLGAARLRLRPILMTAFSFILGVLPLIFASGVYATARNIMGVALVGGMLFATLIGIYLYPTLYYMVARLAGFERRREQKQQQS